MKIGYARISTDDQSLDLQTDALRKEGCEKVFHDVASGAREDRQGLLEAFTYLREGDTLIVWKLDRLGRSLKHLIEICNDLHDKKINFKSMRENIDTSTSVGKLFFHIIAALAEFEREIIRDRTRAGLEAARTRGRTGGRRRKMDPAKITMARALLSEGKHQVREICEKLDISKTTLYRYASVE